MQSKIYRCEKLLYQFGRRQEATATDKKYNKIGELSINLQLRFDLDIFFLNVIWHNYKQQNKRLETARVLYGSHL